MSKFLDPIANAKTVGIVIIALGVLILFFNFPQLLSSSTYSAPISFIFNVLSALILIAVGFGLRKTKLWGLYGLLILVALDILYVGYLLLQGEVTGGAIITTIIYVALAAWLYSAKKRFH